MENELVLVDVAFLCWKQHCW